MPYNLNMENIIIHDKTRDMLPSISSTILHVRYSEHANSKSVQRSPIWRYIKSSIWSGFEIKNWIEDQFQSSPKLVGIWTVLKCNFAPNLEIVTSIGGELWHGKAQNGVNFYFGVQFDLKGQSSHKKTGILTKVFYISVPNLVILAETGDELSRWQAHDWCTDGPTHRQTQATTIPEGKTGLG